MIRAGFVAGGLLVVGLAGGVWWAWRFVNEDLAPLIARQVSNQLNRPVEVGPIEQISLNRIVFGPSAIPATPADADRLEIPRVEVTFNPFEVLWDRTLSVDVTLIRPEAFADQNEDGEWISTRLRDNSGAPEPLVKVEVDALRVRDGTLTLVPFGDVDESKVVEPDEQEREQEQRNPNPEPQDEDAPETLPRDAVARPQLVIQDVDANALFRNNNRLISYDVSGRPETGGEFRVSGESDLDREQTTLRAQGTNLLAPDVNLLVPLPVEVRAGRISSDLEVLFPPGDDDPLQLNGTVQFQNATGRIEQIPQLLSQVNGQLRFRGQDIFFENVRGKYGLIPAQVGGSLNFEQGYNLTARSDRTTIPELLETFDVSSPVPVTGALRSQLRITGDIEEPIIAGVAENITPVRVDRVTFASAQSRYRVADGVLSFDGIQAVPVGGGQVTGNGRIAFGGEDDEEDQDDNQNNQNNNQANNQNNQSNNQGSVAFFLQGQNLPGDTIARQYGANLNNFTIGVVDAQVRVSGTPDNLTTLVDFQAPQATYAARGRVRVQGDRIALEDGAALVAGGIVRANAETVNRRWTADVQASGIELRQFSPDLRGLFSGNFQLAGSLDNFNLAAIEAQGQARFSQGLAIIESPLTADVRWLGDRLQVLDARATGFQADGLVFARLEGTPAITNLDLNVNLRNYAIADLPINTPEQIRLLGQTDFSGRVTGTPDAVQVAGQLGLNNFQINQVAFEPRLTGDLRYTNRGISLDVSGQQDRIALTLDDRNRPVNFFVQQGNAIAQGRTQGDILTATLENFPLQALNLTPAAAYGIGIVTGEASGSIEANIANLNNPSVIGQLVIDRPALGYIAGDRFAAQFRYVDGVAVLEQGELLQAGSRYLLSGTFNTRAENQLQARIVADQGRIEDVLSALNIFDLADFGRGLRPPVFATADAVQPFPVGQPDLTLLNQLRRYSEITALLNQQIAARQQASFLPDLSQLQGAFTGTIDINSSAQTGFNVGFDLAGQNWRWQDYRVDQVIARGELQNGVLTLLPVRFQSDESFLTFSGQFGGEQQSGQLLAEGVPVAALRDLFRLPIDIEGDLTANATLAGSVGNPQVIGEIQLVNTQINNNGTITTLPPLRNLFGYNDARLTFDSDFVRPEVTVAETAPQGQPADLSENPSINSPINPLDPDEPVEPQADQVDQFALNGSIPYKFPFMTVEPASNEFNVDLTVRNDGLALINAFTDQVQWRGGEAEVQLRATGVLTNTQQNLAIGGTAEFANARVASPLLPEDITNINGTIAFKNDQIQVQNLQGEFSRGQVVAQGTLPILLPLNVNNPDNQPPLTISLDKIALDLPDRYEGDVAGQVVLTGTALAPEIGGEVLLSNGEVRLPDQNGQTVAAIATASAPTTRFGDRETDLFSPPLLNNLRVSLGENLRVTNNPLLSFVVAGDLLVDGTIDDLRPDGVIQLQRGQVNLFTTRFNLDRRYNNTVVFESDRGLDPVLDVRLLALVPEVTRYPIPNTSPFAAAEVADLSAVADFGRLETVRVQASVNGPASELFNNLELTSDPDRSQTEILALIGGGNVTAIAQEDGVTTAIASLAGSAVLSQLQNLISNAFGLTDFSLFPTTLISEDARTSTFAIAAELGFDLTDDLSVSILQVLTAPEPTQFNLRYRLSNELSVRGSTNFRGDSRAILQFETRF